MRIFVLAMLATLACVGCDKKEEPMPTTTPAPVKTDKPAAELPRPPVGIAPTEAEPDDDLATTADFEDDAEKDIDKATVEAEVDKLDKEIGE